MRAILGGGLAFVVWAVAALWGHLYWFGQPAAHPATEAAVILTANTAAPALTAWFEGDPVVRAEGRLGFEGGDLHTDEGGAAFLDRLIAWLGEHPDTDLILLARHAESHAASEAPADAGMRRGEALRRELVARGLMPQRTTLVSRPSAEGHEPGAFPLDLLLVPSDSLLPFLAGNELGGEGTGPEDVLAFTRHIRFAYGTARPEPDAAVDAYLDHLAAYLNLHAGRTVEITGHTCDRSGAAFNRELGMRRAGSVRDALVRRGLERGRVSTRSAGEAEPVADNDSEAGRQANRRVEIVIR